MTPGMLQPMLPLKPLERISPSQFPIFRKCKLRAIWSSCNAQALLPLPPSARLGIVIHKILEKAAKGKITGDGSFIPNSQKSNIITVRGLHPDRHPALNKTPDEVSVFSMIHGKVPGSYGEGHLTTIYAGAD